MLYRGDEARLLFCADLVPTRAHLRGPYIMAYDNHPLTTLAEKKLWLPRVAERDDILVFGHDPACDAARLSVKNGEVVIAEEIDLSPAPD